MRYIITTPTGEETVEVSNADPNSSLVVNTRDGVLSFYLEGQEPNPLPPHSRNDDPDAPNPVWDNAPTRWFSHMIRMYAPGQWLTIRADYGE